MHAAIGQAARRGILIKHGEVLERMAVPARLVLDKTGTLTEGRLRVVAWQGDPMVRPLVLALEQDAVHPVARAFREAWPELRAAPDATRHTTLGSGVRGVVGGRRVVVGSSRFVGAGATVNARWTAWADDAAAAGRTPILVAVDDVVVAGAALEDTLRPDAVSAVARLVRLGFVPAILSGDHPLLTQRAAVEVGIPIAAAQGGATPEQKRAVIAAAALQGPVVMVGDGVNDAAALTAAHVGIGVHGGAEACLAVADVHLAAPGLEPLVELAEGARRTMRLIKVLLGVSLAYNAVGAVLAMTGHIDPLIAAVLMPGTSVLNVLAAWRTRTFPGPAR
jgi:Cu2+-exporting ATPase